MKAPINLFKPVLLASCISLAACGGGGGSDPDTGTDPVSILSGTAAAGAALIGTVTVKGALGNTKSAIIEADGNYNVDVSGLTAPYRLRAQGTVGGKTYKLHSYAEEADVGGNVNITPFTDLIIANAAQQIAASYFDDDVLDDTEALDPDVLAAQETALQAKLQDVLSALGVDTAIDLLNSTFSADHSGLDAALDIIQIESTTDNIVTITNLLDSTTISDDILVSDDTEAFVVAESDAGNYTEAVSDTVAIATLFEDFSALFIGGLPSDTDAEAFLAADFLLGDSIRGEFLTEITTDPSMIDLGFTGVSISDLDSVAGTATVKFNVVFGGEIDSETETWFVAYDVTLGWQLQGDQRIVDLDTLNFHCNDYNGLDDQPGGCGINVSFWDENFDNNGTGGAAIASGTMSIIGADGIVKDTVYLGTPDFVAPGEVQVYNEATGEFQGDYKGFGTGLGDIDPNDFAVGDILEYKIYTADLDISTTSTPFVVGTEVATYTNTVLFAPSTTGLYPTATATTIAAISSYTIGSDLTVAWTLVDGTVSDEVLVEIKDSNGNRIEVWDESFASTATSTTITSSMISTALGDSPDFNSSTLTYTILVRIYAEDAVTGQAHSTDYRADIDTSGTDGGTETTLVCGYESGWDDLADGGFGAPINPNSFADYEAVVANCETAQTFAFVDLANKSFLDIDETTTFFNTGSGTVLDPGTGEFNDAGDIISFEWYLESAGNHTYLVIYTDDTIDSGLPTGAWFRETTALIGITGTPGQAGSSYSFVKYSEQSNYSDTDRATGSDGEIWNSSNVLQ